MCCSLKAPHLLQAKSKNELVWHHFKQKKVCLEFVWELEMARQSEMVNTFKLQLVHGDSIIGRCALKLHLL